MRYHLGIRFEMRRLLVGIGAGVLPSTVTACAVPNKAAVTAPRPVSGGFRFVSLTAGTLHTCGLTDGGVAYCWGGAISGKSPGDGTTSAGRSSPVAVPGGLTFSSLATGAGYICGLTLGGAAYCWSHGGNNNAVRDTVTASKDSPVAVPGGMTFTSFTAAWDRACGLTSSGAAYCWRSDAAPLPVARDHKFIGLTGGAGHMCGWSNDGVAYCWGERQGALGPVNEPPLRFVSVSAGSSHACALTDRGEAYCWGQNLSGELGDGTTTGSRSPVPVKAALGFTTLAAGGGHTCGLIQDGTAYCWGYNHDGELGDGTFQSRTTPVRVRSDVKFNRLAAGLAHTCGLTSAGAAYCWATITGDNSGT